MIMRPRSGFSPNPLKRFPRNFPCWCNGGKKAKYCCLPRVRDFIETNFVSEMKLFIKDIFRRNYSAENKKGNDMTRDESIAKGMAAIQDAEQGALGGAFDDGVQSGGGQSEDDIKARIAQAVADAQALDAQALSDAHAEADAKILVVQTALDAMTEKEGIEEQAVAKVNASVEQLQAALDAIKALLAP